MICEIDGLVLGGGQFGVLCGALLEVLVRLTALGASGLAG